MTKSKKNILSFIIIFLVSFFVLFNKPIKAVEIGEKGYVRYFDNLDNIENLNYTPLFNSNETIKFVDLKDIINFKEKQNNNIHYKGEVNYYKIVNNSFLDMSNELRYKTTNDNETQPVTFFPKIKYPETTIQPLKNDGIYFSITHQASGNLVGNTITVFVFEVIDYTHTTSYTNNKKIGLNILEIKSYQLKAIGGGVEYDYYDILDKYNQPLYIGFKNPKKTYELIKNETINHQAIAEIEVPTIDKNKDLFITFNGQNDKYSKYKPQEIVYTKTNDTKKYIKIDFENKKLINETTKNDYSLYEGFNINYHISGGNKVYIYAKDSSGKEIIEIVGPDTLNFTNKAFPTVNTILANYKAYDYSINGYHNLAISSEGLEEKLNKIGEFTISIFSTTLPNTKLVKIVIKDDYPPIIRGFDDVYINRGDFVNTASLLSYFTATDNIEGNITNKIEVVENTYEKQGDIKGEYSIILRVSDNHKNRTIKKIRVFVVDNYSSFFTTIEGEKLNINVSSTYSLKNEDIRNIFANIYNLDMSNYKVLYSLASYEADKLKEGSKIPATFTLEKSGDGGSRDIEGSINIVSAKFFNYNYQSKTTKALNIVKSGAIFLVVGSVILAFLFFIFKLIRKRR